ACSFLRPARLHIRGRMRSRRPLHARVQSYAMTALGYVLFFCGQLGVMALARFFFQWLLRFAGGDASAGVAPLLSASAVGAVFLGFRIFDGVTDPVAGAISDSWVRRGRERR